MTNQNQNLPQPSQPPAASPGRKPYVKPAFRFERVFETRALSCGKVSDTQGSCHHNRRTS